MDEFIGEAVKPALNPQSKLYKFMCAYGVWLPGSETYSNHCRPLVL